MKNNRWNPSKPALLASVALLSALLLAPGARSAQSDISSTPIASTNSAQVKPNVMLLMDTSGSMGWSHMPDEVEPITGVGSVGYKNAKCNTLYYNRDTTYPVPKRADGSEFTTPTLGSAPYAGYVAYFAAPDATDGTTVDLSTAFRAYDGKTLRNTSTTPDPAQPAYYYVYSGSQTLNYATSPCTDGDIGADPGAYTGATRAATGGGTWTRVLVSTTSGNASRPGATNTNETENFAIWYSYYRTRISMTKSAASMAFTPLTDSYRVGFITVQPKDTPTSTSINPAKYVAISDFNSTQRGLWFDKVFAQIPGGASPAREGLARVGRHYGGKQDGINAGMTGDPVQYSCQQNFTIMTTDGYWNSQTESSNVTGGPVDLSGVRLDLVGGGPKKNWDNPFTGTAPLSMNVAGVVSGQSPRPIFDGAADRTDVLTNNQNTYSYATCGTFAYLSTLQNRQSTAQILQITNQTTQSTQQNLQSTSQIVRNTAQNLQTTAQVTQSTTQARQSTVQNLQSTNQNLQSTTQTRQSTAQNLTSTTQNLRNTTQNLRNTSQIVQTTTRVEQTVTVVNRSTSQLRRSTTQITQSTNQPRQSTVQNRQSTNQNLRSTVQNRQSTTQTTQSTVQNRRSTNQNLRSTTQNLRSTTQVTATTTQVTQSTAQMNRSTSQLMITTTQLRQSTSQTKRCDAQTELCNFVAPGTCTAGGFITCEVITTGPTLVASCSPASATSGNNYVTTTCASTSTGPTGTASCTPSGATSGNSYTTTTCASTTTGPTPVASCTAAAAGSGNSWTATTCNNVTTGPTGVASCTAASASSGNNYTATTCGSTSSGPTGVSSCTAATASAGNGWTATTCGSNNTTNVPVATCTAAAASSGNSWTATTCPAAVVTTNVPVATCTAAAASSGNSYVTTTCPAPVTTGPTGVSSCTAATASSGNAYTATTCGTNNTTNVPVATCTAAAAAAGNSWTATTCPAAVVTTNVPVATCTAAAASSGNSWTTTTCPAPVVTTNVPVATCTAATAASGNSWTTTTCPAPVTTGPTPVASCTPVAAAAGNSYTATTCPAPVTTGPTGVASCTAVAGSAGNSWVTTSCGNNNTTNVGVATCTAATAASGNAWTTTTCNTATTGPTPAATCTAAAAASGNSWTATTCTTNNTGPTAVASCTPITATAGNAWTTTTCPVTTTTNVPVATCAASGPTAGNAYTTTTCPAPVVTTNVAVASCTPATASSGNSWTTRTCSTNNTTNVPVATCTAAAATSGNGWTTTTCPAPLTTGPTGVASCAPIVASAGNSWVATTCGTNNTSSVPVATCTASGPTAGNGYTTTTCGTNNVSGIPSASCTPTAASAGNSWTTTTCPAPVTTGPTGVASCAPVAAAAGNNWTATTCGTNPTSVPVQTCTPVGPTAGNGYTTTTCGANNTTDVPVATCTPSAATVGNSWVATTCNPATSGPTLVTACAPEVASSGNNWIATTCVPAPGKKTQYFTTNTVTTTLFSGNIQLGLPTVVTNSTAVADVDGFCYAPGAEPPLPTPNPGPSGTPNPGPNPPVGCASWPCLSAGPTADGSINSLADVAQYYYITDLRPSMVNDVKTGAGTGAEADTAKWQHMTTFTIALGVSGTLNYLPNYLSSAATTGDFADIRTGAKSWPLWPDPAVNTDPGTGGSFDNWNNPRSIDDFWHAAVNGRGQYFSADSPTSVVSGLSGALAASLPRPSAGAAAGASTLEPVAGDNSAFIGSYKTFEWSGDVIASQFDIATGAISATVDWSAQAQLDLKTKAACDNRSIYLMRAGATNNLVNFSWSTQQCDASGAPAGAITDGLNATERGYFGLSNLMLMSQYPAMSAAQRTAAEGANLVNFLRGQRGFENFESGVATTLYRVRPHVLGDVVGGQPVYVKAPLNGYVDTGYQAFKAAQAARTPMVYVAANDGMLHALYAGTVATDPNYALRGQEAWAIIPSAVLPNMWKLADANYGNSHQFYVDGTPVVGDVVNTADSAWRTMLVGGLNAGGKGYYAIDITDPATPKAMWEFKFGTCYDGTAATAGADCHIGLTYGKPIITKVIDSSYPEGRWVVIVSSGYNNVRGAGLSGDGSGYLYVLDAITGAIVHKIDTGAGSAATPSNLGQLNAYVDDGSVNNTAVRVYGGDMLGNIWRFDVNDTHAPTGLEATLLGQARDSSNNPQPITIRPELAELNGKPMVFVSTGRMLGTTDITDTQRQSMYGIVDPLTGSPVYSDLRGSLKPMVISQTGTGLTATRTVACDPAASAATCALTNGWVTDLPDTGERVNVDMKLALGTLVIASNVPPTSACDNGGYAWFNYVDFASGNAVLSSPGGVISVRTDSGQTVGFSILRLTDGTFRGFIRGAGDGSVDPGSCVDCELKPLPVDPPKPKGKRISWREIAQ